MTFHSAALAEALDADIRSTLDLIGATRGRLSDDLRSGVDLQAWRNERALAQMRRAVIMTDREQRILWASPAFERVTGYRQEDALGTICDELFGFAALNPDIVAQLDAHMADMKPFRREIKIANAWGGTQSVHLERLPDVDPYGRVIWLSLFSEMASSTSGAAAPEEVEKRALAIAESQGQWYFETDTEDRFVRVWGAPAVAHGKRVGLRREDVAAEDTTTEKWDRYRDAIASRERYQDFVYRVSATPVDRLIAVSGGPRFDQNGQFLGYEGVSRDVTDVEQNRVNAMLVAAALEGIQEMIALFDRDGTVRFMNQAFVQSFDIDVEAVHRRATTIEDLTRYVVRRWSPELDDAAVERMVADRLEQYRGADAANDFRFGDRWIRITDRATPDGGRLIVGFDNSQARASKETMTAALEKAEASARAADAFLARMSHELRTPLNAIIGLSELMTTDEFQLQEAKLKEYAGDINRSGQHLLDLIQDILEFSSIRARDRTLAAEEVDLDGVIEEALAIIRPILTRRQQDLQVTRTAGRATAILGDARAVKQILINLLTNAAKYGREGGRIELGTGLRNDQVTLTIIDDGLGIAPRDLPHVFDPFYRCINPMNATADDNAVEGTGLGLAIVKSLTERMNGQVTLDSIINHGTRVEISLPAMDAAGDRVTRPLSDRQANRSPDRNAADQV
ncbi:MAG: ATP-binding protein [Thalassobaculaceae bacterium]|nr:ATP-binding protein [Thalassobaculaceae bacterium]